MGWVGAVDIPLRKGVPLGSISFEDFKAKSPPDTYGFSRQSVFYQGRYTLVGVLNEEVMLISLSASSLPH
jgi:hypothetical protein